MASETNHKQNDKSGKFLPALCKTVGTIILSIAIILMLPIAVPKMLGYEVFSVISGSMEPEKIESACWEMISKPCKPV